jgi:hypothetical protein
VAYSRETVTAARALRAEEWTLREISHHLGVSLGRVSEWVRDVEVPMSVDQPPPAPLPVWNSGTLRWCPRCELTLPVELFGRLGEALQGWCKPCFRNYRAANRAAARTRAAERIQLARDFVRSHLARNPCMDCGEPDLVVLEFDHVRAKRVGISTLVARGAPLARLAGEIARCEVVCVNCHRRRSLARRPVAPNPPTGERRTLRQRNAAYVRAHLLEHPCVDCGEADLTVLDFDHRSDKKAKLSALAHGEYSLERIDAEIAKCDVRCGNGHRRKTAADFGYARYLDSSAG